MKTFPGAFAASLPAFVFGLLAFTAAGLRAAESTPPLLEARRGFETRLLRKESIGEAAATPPEKVFQLVSYPSPLGRNAAYISQPPADGKKRPAIIWLVGGFSNSISDIAWTPGPKSNDQSASGFREAGVVMMYPSLRGGNNNPGYIEAFMGEVDDVLAAAKFLAACEYVDASRIYLGGHSTGGTLALLVAAAGGDRFRAVFALGPVEEVSGYGADVLPFDLKNPKERQLRAPQFWLAGIRCPTFVFEGTKAPANIASLRALEQRSKNPLLHFTAISGETHFSIIAPLVADLARSIVEDRDAKAAFQLRRAGR
jgi:acetyl esterase/lipase